MLYRLLQLYIPLAAKVYCRKVFFKAEEKLPQKGPLIIASNHPNTFLDAIIIGLRFSQPVYFLARGDAFHNAFAEKILRILHVIPIYRLSEGREYLNRNQNTFERCRKILADNGIVLIFSEGICENEWKLRPLMKGTARLAIDCWNDEEINDQLQVIPFGLNYNSYTSIGKIVLLKSGKVINKNDIDFEQSFGGQLKQFNLQLEDQLKKLVLHAEVEYWPKQHRRLFKQAFQHIELAENNRFQKLQRLSEELSLADQSPPKNRNSVKNLFLILNKRSFLLASLIIAFFTLLPAAAGWLLNSIFYYPLRYIIKKKTRGTVFYDGVFFALLVLLYPFYLIIFSLMIYIIIGYWWCWLLMIITPIAGWYVIYFRQLCQRLKLILIK